MMVGDDGLATDGALGAGWGMHTRKPRSTDRCTQGETPAMQLEIEPRNFFYYNRS